MSIRSILTQVQTHPSGLARLQFAADLARQQGADLIGVGVQAFIPYVSSAGAFGYMDGGAVQAIRNEIDREIEVARVKFQETLDRFGISGEWRSAVDEPVDVIARLSRSADLIIATRNEAGAAPAATAMASDLLMLVGRPVLVIPPAAKAIQIKRAVVGWKDSREARRVITDALPLIGAAERVLVLEFCAPDEMKDGAVRTEAVARYLARHGVKAESRPVGISTGRIAAQIVDAARADNADLLVTGAYAHARLREWVLGGVTQDLLDGSPMPCLFSH